MKKLLIIFLLIPFYGMSQDPQDPSTYSDCTTYTDTIEICRNSLVNFKEFSYSSMLEPIEWYWSFQGATPDTSTKQNPDSIGYYTSGLFNVKCSTVFINRFMFFRTSSVSCMMIKVLEDVSFGDVLIKDTTICQGDEIILNAETKQLNDTDINSLNFNYLWTSKSSSITEIFVTTKTLKVNKEGFYKVRVFTQCDFIEKEIEVKYKNCEPTYYIPNSFTPDNNGLNDIYKINIDNYFNFYLKIYNRWGELLFQTTDPLIGWDGTYKNTPCKQDLYPTFIIINNKSFVTNIHLIR